jgi:hypothetical protein
VFHRRRHPRCGDDIPVVYITVPPAATPKMIAAEFARFLGLPVTRRANITDIIEAVCGVCTDTKTSLAARHRVHRRTIRQALSGPVPPPRKTPQRTSALGRLHDPITGMLTTEPGMPVRQVWERLLDEHDAGVSCATVRDYVTRLRAGIPGQGE